MSNPHPGLLALVPSLFAIIHHLGAAETVTITAAPPPRGGLAAAQAEVAGHAGGAVVVDGEDVRRGRASTWQDLLHMATGVFIQPRHGADESRLSLRGSGLQRTFHARGVLLLADGTPANLTDGSVDFQSVAPVLTDHVTVYRGANGQALGASNLGGAIDVVSPTGHDAPPLTVAAEGGAFGYARGTIAAGASHGGKSGAWDMWAGATADESRGYRDHARSQDQRVQGNVGYRIDEQWENRVFLGWSQSDSELPGSLTRAQLEDDPRQAAVANVSGDQHRDFPLLRAADRLRWQAGGQRLELAMAYSRKDLFHPIFQVIDQLSQDGLGSARYELTSGVNRFTVLATAGLGLTRAQQFLNVGGERGAETDDGWQRATNQVLDIGDEVTLGHNGRTRLLAGVQFTRATREFDDQLWGGTAGADRSDSYAWRGASPRVGVIHDLAEGVQAFANLSRSFEAPSFGEIVAVGTTPGLLDLDPQTATTVEVGTRGGVERATWDVSVYHAWLHHELIGYQVAPGQTRTLNADRTTHSGIELGGDLVPLAALLRADDRLRLRASYLYNRFRFHDDEQFGDNRIAGVPPQYARVELLYEWGDGWYTGPSTELAAAGDVDHADTTQAPGWALFGAKAGYRAADGFSAWIEGRNLMDRIYAATYGVVTTATATSAVYNPGDGRAVYAGLGWRW